MAGIQIAGITLEFIGTVLIARTAIRVHDRVRIEHNIDEKVISEMKKERNIGVFGVVLIVVGYVLHVAGLVL
ncbi:MAG: hypothetical protein COV95_00095 [Candidatus Zambryskibacteria bacterium CG11_big_fil_rev_8_21_14_0_20_40_24]|uniref:Uncharacterized protein n=1 Tax=Candidatus Zambryskibacteria bacterium CG11_big_fil_rev_8_21_14_0_20_40_24 TaxID=1975116 RepID=A0A2H0K7G0_9BACT|nr:MAG: hypothetical protein COV95_00095 [Candidatus Zambryskibacteria bacterium CG11_big_fil_rev_8_21_14_0_20_40_24]